MNQTDRKLYRSKTDRILAGVCGGLGEYFNIDPLIFRAIFIVLLFVGGSSVVLYIILWIVIPEEPVAGSPENPHGGEDKAQHFASEVKNGAERIMRDVRGGDSLTEGRRNIAGAIIIILGLLLLLNQVLPFRIFRWDIFWPVLIIVFGIAVLVRRSR